MPNYQYQIRTGGGQMTTGQLVADNAIAAAQALRAQGNTVLNLTPISGGASATDWKAKLAALNYTSGPNAKDVLGFTTQLAVMVRAGISIRAALEGIADQTENAKFKQQLYQIKQDVEGGKPFSDALARHPKQFGPLYVNMVRASEMSGSFSQMLDRIASYLQQQIETRSMVVGAMIYPCAIAGVAISVVVFLLTFVLPKFASVFEGKESAMPGPTIFLMGLSSFMVQWWWAERMFNALYISRGLHTMGELVNAGVPMLDTLQITGEVTGNRVYHKMWKQVYTSVKQGKKIAQPLYKAGRLPKSVIQMVAAGEESGKLGEVLDEVSQFYSRKLKETIKTVTSMIEPVMIIIMGVVVGFIAMAIILPIFKLSSLVK